LLEGVEHVHVDIYGLPGAPDETAGEEYEEEEHAVVPLERAAGHVDLVQEPVNIEEGAGELVENKSWGVKVDKGPLHSRLVFWYPSPIFSGGLTYPKLNTQRAEIAWKSMPMPNNLTYTVLTIRS
jgi:hypothetical protein